MFLENPAQITECLPDDQGIGVLVPKSGGGHSPWLDVGVAVTFGDDQKNPAAEGTTVVAKMANRTTLNRVSWCLHTSLHILSLTSLLTVLRFRIYSIVRSFTFLVSLIRIGYRLQVF